MDTIVPPPQAVPDSVRPRIMIGACQRPAGVHSHPAKDPRCLPLASRTDRLSSWTMPYVLSEWTGAI